MPRTLIQYAVHPPTPVANPPKHRKCHNYIFVVIAIIVVILFCESLFHSNDPHSPLSTTISSYHPIQLPNANRMLESYKNNAEASSDSLEHILRPIRPYDTKLHDAEPLPHVIDIDEVEQIAQQHDNKKLLQIMSQNQQISHKHVTKEDHTNNNKKDISNTDYWDFPLHSQSKPSATSSAQHRGEYEMHLARKKWFKEHYIDKHKSLVPSSNLIVDFDTRCPVFETNTHCQWTPPLSELCNWQNSAIFWHSMHGTMIGRDFRNAKAGEHWMWQFADELRVSQTCECPDNVAFVFADNREKEMRLSERSYVSCNENCHFYRVANEYHPWDWFGKIGPLLELIEGEAFQGKYEYVVLTDADDQTLIKSPMDIVKRFEFYNASIVIAGEATSYPNWQNAEKGFENAVSPWSRHHQHLNAGGFMGKIVNMIPYLEYMKKDYLNFTVTRKEEIKERGRNFWRDQTVWRTMHMLFYPDIKIDSLAKLWSRTDVYMYDL